MLKTGMYNKLEEMKNGGYTLFSDKTRKMLLAMGLSLLSVGTLSQVANAELAAEVQWKKTGGENLTEGKYRYQIELKEDDPTYKLAGIYASDGTTPVTMYYGSVDGKQEATVVIEVDSAATEVVVKNNNATPDEATITLTDAGTVDNDGPALDERTLIRYVTEEGKYLQARFTDGTKIYMIEDQDNHERVLLKEKEQDKDVTIKYILEDDDEAFTIYDLLGNPTTVQLSDAKIQTLFNARDLEGKTITIDVTRTFTETDETDPENPVTTTYELTGIKTGAGEELTLQDEEHDIYTNLPAGTTKLILTYTNPNDPTDTKTVILPLVLDKTGPAVLKYSKVTMLNDNDEPEGYTITEDKTLGSARAYFNIEKGKGIVEVKDIQSGIAKIVTLKTVNAEYVEESVVYNVEDLTTTVLWLFNVTENTTAVRVYDGVGNKVDIPLVTDENEEGTTLATIRKEEDGTYTLLAQDTQAGLGKIIRDGEENDLANFYGSNGFKLPEKTPRNENQMYYHGGHYENGTWVAGTADKVYAQYTLDKFEMTIDDEGKPKIYILDALGNSTLVDFDEFAFACHYATYNETDSLSISVTESRGIWKISTTIRDIDAPSMPAIPESPEPSPAPEQPSQARPEGDDILEEPTSQIPAEEDLETPPEEGTTARVKWDEWVAANASTAADGPQSGEQFYVLFTKYLRYVEQQNIIKEHADYEAQQQLIADWDEYELWQAWDEYHTWRDTYANTYTLEVFAENGEPENFTRTYEVPEGIVEEVRIYNTHGDNELYNSITNTSTRADRLLIDIKDLTDADRVTTTQSKLAHEEIGGQDTVYGATLTAKHGIKQVTYSDGCVIKFYDELPTELFVNCKVLDETTDEETVLTAVVTDAIGDTATITGEGVVCEGLKTVGGNSSVITYNEVTLA